MGIGQDGDWKSVKAFEVACVVAELSFNAIRDDESDDESDFECQCRGQAIVSLERLALSPDDSPPSFAVFHTDF